MRRDVILSVSLLAAACGTPPPLTTAATEPATVASASPDADRDGDGVPDPRDLCPNEPEDCDGFEDDDGCPELDDDHDGILDTCDVCPNRPETYQGWGDRDGCPDTSADIHRHRDHPANTFAAPLVWIRLAPGTVDAPAAELDQAVSLFGAARDRIEAITCVAQAAKDEKDPARLSERRAARACEAIVKRGVPAAIVTGAHGVGTRPARAVEPDSLWEPAPMVLILVTRAQGLAIWTWNGSIFEQSTKAPENREPEPKDPRCTEMWAPPPPAGRCR